MDTSKIEKRLHELDKELHEILNMIEKEKKNGKNIVDSSVGAWEYDIDSVEFVRELRKSDRTNRSS